MRRVITALCFGVSLSSPLMAEPVCVVCDEPAATYRCTLEEPTRDSKFKVGELAQDHVCEKVLAGVGPHKKCHAMTEAEVCDGAPRTVTLTDYQRAMSASDDGESTYQPGVFELARREVYAAWVCMSSLFSDC